VAVAVRLYRVGAIGAQALLPSGHDVRERRFT
jgi:hypothetical protein